MRRKRKRFKPVVFLIPENTDDLFINVEHLQLYKESSPMCRYFYEGLVLGFGKNIFVFDAESCDFFFKEEK